MAGPVTECRDFHPSRGSPGSVAPDTGRLRAAAGQPHDSRGARPAAGGRSASRSGPSGIRPRPANRLAAGLLLDHPQRVRKASLGVAPSQTPKGSSEPV